MATGKRGRPRKNIVDIDEAIRQGEERVKELESQMEKEQLESEEASKQATKLPTKSEAEAITNVVPSYPQDEEDDEYRYFDWAWWNDIARGLTAGAKVIRHKDREHRDRLECDHCGVTLVSDAIPIGVSPRMKGNDMY